MNAGALTNRASQHWPQLYAKIAGGLYLIVIVGGIFAELLVRAHLVVHGDAAATAHSIEAHELLYRAGFVAELFYCVCNVPLILILYNLFKIVNKPVAMMMVYFALITNVIECTSLLAHFAPLILLGHEHYLGAFTTEQLDAAALISVQLFEHGFAMCLVFFGFDCFAMAYLIVHSKFMPRFIGVLLAIEGIGYLVNSFSLFLVPTLQPRIFPYFSITAIAEVALCLWLLVMGVNVQRWKQQATASSKNT